MDDAFENRFFSLNPQTFKVVSVYDDAITRERAMRVCDYLVRLMWQDAELKFHWWRTGFFRDDGLAKMAAQNAAEADFVILCSSNDTAISPEVEAWFERWVDRREINEGALVNLITPANAGTGSMYRDGFLAEASRRAKLELMTVIIHDSEKSLRISVDLQNPVSQTQMYSHFGLNE